MDENKNLTPEEELDRLLAKFLAEDDDDPVEPVEVVSMEEATEDMQADPEEIVVEDDQPLPPTTQELWENIDAEDPVAPADTGAETDVPVLQEIGPDEDALASIGQSRAERELAQIIDEFQPEEPDWVSEPTAVIPNLKQTTTQLDSTMVVERISEDTGFFEPAESQEETEDPLNDPALRSLLFDETASFKDEEFRDTFGEVGEIYSSAPEQPEEEVTEETEETEEAEEPAPQRVRQENPPVRKRRPKNKHAYGLLSIPHILTTIVWLALVVAIGASLGRMLWMCAADVLAFGRPDQTVYVTITKTDTLDTVAEKLHRAGLINYPGLFKLYGKLSNIMDDLSIGTYELNTLYDYHALSTSMSEKPAMRVTVKVTIPEGYNCAQIFKLLEEKEVCTVAELENYASNSQFADYWFLEGTERGNKYCLEGFLFPDTYEFYVDSDAKEVYIKLLAAFDYRFTDTMKEKLVKLNEYLNAKMKKQGLDQSYIDSHQITIREVVIIASLIEKESSGIEDDSYNISSVIYNRLTNPGNHPYLGLNSTLVYYTGRSELTSEDFQDDHPYNTYTRPGLVPGPIANPGRASLDAALDPSDTGYYYFVLNPKTGTHEYSKTYAEHQQKVEEFAKLEGQ
jgi:UPF0755 protein